MNPQQSPTIAAERPGARNKSETRLQGRWLVLARMLWLALVVLILALFVATIPAFSNDLHNACATAACHTLIPPYNAQQYGAAGFSVNFVLIYTYALCEFLWQRRARQLSQPSVTEACPPAG